MHFENLQKCLGNFTEIDIVCTVDERLKCIDINVILLFLNVSCIRLIVVDFSSRNEHLN